MLKNDTKKYFPISILPLADTIPNHTKSTKACFRLTTTPQHFLIFTPHLSMEVRLAKHPPLRLPPPSSRHTQFQPSANSTASTVADFHPIPPSRQRFLSFSHSLFWSTKSAGLPPTHSHPKEHRLYPNSALLTLSPFAGLSLHEGG